MLSFTPKYRIMYVKTTDLTDYYYYYFKKAVFLAYCRAFSFILKNQHFLIEYHQLHAYILSFP